MYVYMYIYIYIYPTRIFPLEQLIRKFYVNLANYTCILFIVVPYFKAGGRLHEEIVKSPRPPCFMNGPRISLSEGRNILGLFSNLYLFTVLP